MSTVEKYLRPEVIRQISRLDLRAQFIVKGFLQGLHASPFQGFSVEFSEHRKYTPGDDPADIDWLVYAKTDKYYIKKFEAETNITGYLVMDLSRSMGYTYRQELTKFEYGICLAAALCYLMVHQQDPVGLITFDEQIRQSLPARSKRTQLGHVISLLANLQPTGKTDIARSLHQIAAMLKHRSLVMLFSDLFAEPEGVLQSLRRLRHGGHDVILFHILDEAEVRFPFDGMVEFEEPETADKIQVDANDFRADYQTEVRKFCDEYRRHCFQSGIDYVGLDTSMQFDKALTEYLVSRRARY
jgi:uncharacterized protein (DUF58 family)